MAKTTGHPIDDLTLADDFIFGKVMSRPDIAKRFIELFTNRRIETITELVQQAVANPTFESHGVRFDVKFEGDGTIYDIEMQQTGGASKNQQRSLLHRVRYYQGSVDIDQLSKGAKYESLKPTMIIFVCTFDPFGAGLAKYTQTPCIHETGKIINNGTTVLYLNATFTKSNLGREASEFLQYVTHPEMITPQIGSFIHVVEQAVADAKVNTENRREYMSLNEKNRAGS